MSAIIKIVQYLVETVQFNLKQEDSGLVCRWMISNSLNQRLTDGGAPD